MARTLTPTKSERYWSEYDADDDGANAPSRTICDTHRAGRSSRSLWCIALGFHLAEPGVVGLMVIVLATALNGVTEEHRIGHAFEEALPFTALLVVFFAIVAVIDHQGLFSPVIDWVLDVRGQNAGGPVLSSPTACCR